MQTITLNNGAEMPMVGMGVFRTTCAPHCRWPLTPGIG